MARAGGKLTTSVQWSRQERQGSDKEVDVQSVCSPRVVGSRVSVCSRVDKFAYR